MYYAILHAGVSISLAVTYAGIVIGSFFFGWLFGKEQFTKEKAMSAIFGFVGLGLVFSPSFGSFAWVALVAALISGLSAGANGVFSKLIHYNAAQSTLAVWLTTLISSLIMATIVADKPPAFGWHIQWFYLACFAVASLVASWSYIKGLKLIDAGAAGILGLLEIVFAVLFGVIFFHEKPSPIALVGI